MASNEIFRLEAPYPALASTMILPRPRIGNNQGLNASVTVLRMMDGSKRTFVTRGDGKKIHRWDFDISRDKMEEFADFMRRYRGNLMRATWRSRTIIGRVSATPIEFGGNGRAGGWPGDEAYGVTLELREDDPRTRDTVGGG